MKKQLFLSAELSTLSAEENWYRTELLRSMMYDLNIDYSPIIGVYKGTQEKSFLINLKDQEEMNTLKKIAFNNFDQESIMFKNIDNSCMLIFQGDNREYIGQFKEINPKYIETLENYSIIERKFYTVA